MIGAGSVSARKTATPEIATRNCLSVKMSNILTEIVNHKRTEIAAARARVPLTQLESLLPLAPPVRDFTAALRTRHPMGVIAEVKKASPSAGIIREDFEPVQIARTYAAHGAACISVLTDEKFFQGHLDFLKRIRLAVEPPVLRKDFILDRYQIVEARAAGADAVLLIAECLSDAELTDLHACIIELGMQALVEIYDPENLERVLDLGVSLIGINNRDLRSFHTDLGHCTRLRQQIPSDVLGVGESGIHSRADVERLMSAGVHAILVGESLMRSPEIGPQLDRLLGR